MSVPLTPGCVIYGLAALAFSASVIASMAITILAARARRKELNHLPWTERLHIEATAQERVFHGYLQKLGITAFCVFAVGIFIEFLGNNLGLFAGQTACPDGWPDPRSLRALAAQET